MGNIVSSYSAYAAWTWEVLRRRTAYLDYYNSLLLEGFTPVSLNDDTVVLKLPQSYPRAEKFGLLFPANPELDAITANVFWHPKVFKSVMRFHVVEKAHIDPNDKPIFLPKYPTNRTHCRDVNGTHHIRIYGENVWFQLQCNNLHIDTENIYIGVDFNRTTDMEKRIESGRELSAIYNGSRSLNDPIHVPKRIELHKQSMIAYDIKTAGGTWNDVAVALHGKEILNLNPDEFKKYWQSGRNALKRAEAFIYGDYLRILDQN